MAQNPNSASAGTGSSALEKEADHVDNLMNSGESKGSAKEAKEGTSGLNNSTQVEQDSRVEKAKADAKAAGGGPDKPEDDLNQDG